MKKLLLILLCLPIIFSSCKEEENPFIPVNNIYGCTSINAFNYNPNANTDDGSCVGFPQDIDGIQLGEFYLGGTVFHLDTNNNLGIVFKGYYCQQDHGYANFGGIPPSFLPIWQDLGTDTLFGSGISNTQILFNDFETTGFSGILLYDEFSKFRSDCWGESGAFDPTMYENGNINSGGWYIPSLEEAIKIYDYGIIPHWDTIQFPNGIRGWGHQYYSMLDGTPFYSSTGAGYFPYFGTTEVYTSSEATTPSPSMENQFFYTLNFSNGNPMVRAKGVGQNKYIMFGIRNFYYNP